MPFKKKDSTAEDVFALTLPLHCEPWQRDRLNKIFRCCNNLKNALIRKELKALKQLERTNAWRTLQAEISAVYASSSEDTISAKQKKMLKPLFQKRNAILKEYGFTKLDFEAKAYQMRKHYGKLIHSDVASKIAYSVWASFDSYLYGKGKQISFSPIGDFESFEGKCNATGPRYADGVFKYGSLEIKVRFSKNDPFRYEEECLKRKIHYVRLIRRWYPEGWRYFMQLILGGKPPEKIRRSTGEYKHVLGKGRVGLDIGTQTLAVSSENAAQLHVLADKVQSIEDEIRRIGRAMDRSRKATNPAMFKADGQIVTIDKLPDECIIQRPTYKKRKWINSKRYRRLAAKRKYLYRAQADLRRQMHGELANNLLPLGNRFFIEDMNYQALAKRSKETKKTKDGKFRSKKRFGKSIANKAPATFVNILESKVQRLGGTFSRVSTFDTKASQYDHSTKCFKKKKLSQRWHVLEDGTKLQRDLYSAFLLQSLNETMDGYDHQYIDQHYNRFKELHDLEIQRLTTLQIPASVGIRKVG